MYDFRFSLTTSAEAKERRLSRKDQWRISYLMSWIFWHTKMTHRFLIMLYLQKYCQLKLNGAEMDKMKESCWIHTTVQAKNSPIKLFNYIHVLVFKKNIRMIVRLEAWAQRLEPSRLGYSRALKLNGICFAGFLNCLGLLTSYSLFLSLPRSFPFILSLFKWECL